MTRSWPTWLPDMALGAAVLALGCLEILDSPSSGDGLRLLVVSGIAVAACLFRLVPGAALAITWATCGLQVMSGVDVMAVEVAVAVVAFGTARWGGVATLWCSAASIPLGAAIAVLFVAADGVGGLFGVSDYQRFLGAAGLTDTWWLGAGLVGSAVLGAPWLAGLAIRLGDRARLSRVSQLAAEQDTARALGESQQAQEIARLREEQARMARDVHDAVGHSLAVILAQAESAQYLKGSDSGALEQTLGNIANSARSSLQDVRQVLTSTNEAVPTVQQGLDSLIEGLRSSRHNLTSTVSGDPQPLLPELNTVAYRVLQEMLTNVIKHGRRDSPVTIARHWDDSLRIEVRNGIDQSGQAADAYPGATTSGRGVEGMRRRLEAVGGRLHLEESVEPDGSTFTAIAWVPLRTASR